MLDGFVKGVGALTYFCVFQVFDYFFPYRGWCFCVRFIFFSYDFHMGCVCVNSFSVAVFCAVLFFLVLAFGCFGVLFLCFLCVVLFFRVFVICEVCVLLFVCVFVFFVFAWCGRARLSVFLFFAFVGCLSVCFGCCFLFLGGLFCFCFYCRCGFVFRARSWMFCFWCWVLFSAGLLGVSVRRFLEVLFVAVRVLFCWLWCGRVAGFLYFCENDC